MTPPLGGLTGGAKPRLFSVVPMEPKKRLPLKCSTSLVDVDRVLAVNTWPLTGLLVCARVTVR